MWDEVELFSKDPVETARLTWILSPTKREMMGREKEDEKYQKTEQTNLFCGTVTAPRIESDLLF